MQHRSRLAYRVVALVCATVVTVAGCGGDDDDSDDASSATTASADAQDAEVEAYVGLTEEEAGEKAESAGTPWRVISRDGEALPATMDYQPDRLNFTVDGGEVTLVTTG